MAIFAQKEIDSIRLELDGLLKTYEQFLAEKDVLETDLAGYESEGYEQFKKVLEKEKIRLALLRMTVDSADLQKHDRLQGQFNECELLERNKDSIERMLSFNSKKLSETSNRIEALKKQIKSRTERK